jgi:serine/threonine protein kinase
LELLLVPTGYFEAVDLWSVGCIHMELLARQPLFPGKDHADMLRRIAVTLGLSAKRDLSWAPPGHLEEAQCVMERLQLPAQPETKQRLETRVPNASETCLDFVRRLLEKVPTRRISAAEAIAHDYLSALRDDAGETTARQQFSWDFDQFELSTQALKDRIYVECVRFHPEIVARDAKWLSARGFQVGTAGA